MGRRRARQGTPPHGPPMVRHHHRAALALGPPQGHPRGGRLAGRAPPGVAAPPNGLGQGARRAIVVRGPPHAALRLDTAAGGVDGPGAVPTEPAGGVGEGGRGGRAGGDGLYQPQRAGRGRARHPGARAAAGRDGHHDERGLHAGVHLWRQALLPHLQPQDAAPPGGDRRGARAGLGRHRALVHARRRAGHHGAGHGREPQGRAQVPRRPRLLRRACGGLPALRTGGPQGDPPPAPGFRGGGGTRGSHGAARSGPRGGHRRRARGLRGGHRGGQVGGMDGGIGVCKYR